MSKPWKRPNQEKLYVARVLNHQCPHCGDSLPDGYVYVTCEACRRDMRERARRKKKTAGAATPNGQ